MFCSNCGSPVGDNEKFCKACGTPVNVQSAQPVMQQTPVSQQPVQQVAAVQSPIEKSGISDEEKARRKKNGTTLGIISIALLFGMSAIVLPLAVTRVLDDYPLFAVALAFIYVAAVIVAYVMMIVSLVKYRSVLSKVMIWIYGIILIVTVVSGVIMMVSFGMDCYNDCTECVHHF